MAFDPDAFRRAAESASRRYACSISPFLGGLGVNAAIRGQPIGALLIPASIAGSLLCEPSSTPGYAPPAYGTPASNGQCPGGYSMTLGWTRYQDSGGSQATTDLSRNAVLGPVRVVRYDLRFGLQTSVGAGGIRILDGNNQTIVDVADAWGIVPNTFVYRLLPFPNNLDNCGSQPPIYIPSPPGLPPPPLPPVDPDGNPVLPGREFPEPYQPDTDKPPIFLPIVFPPIVLKPDISFPITVPVNVGGIKVGDLILKFDGTIELNFGQSQGGGESKDYTAILNEIKACACPKPAPPVCDYDLVDIPYLDTSDSANPCKVSNFKLQVAPGGLSTQNADRLLSTTVAAVNGCKAAKPVQEPEVLIAVGAVPDDAPEQFTPPIPPEIVSVRIRITSVPSSLSKIQLFPGAEQYKFGSVAFSLIPARAGGDYVYIFDRDTYIPLPRRAKSGVIRLLLKAGVGWEVYDTGERL